MTGYTRADSVNNIADGNIINASDLDGEFDAVQAAFNNSTGHVHDGTAANGAPITKIGPTQDVVASAIALLPKTTATVDVGSSSLKFKDFFFSGAGSVTGTITAGGFSGTVGATTPAAGTFTSLSDSGNLTFTGTGNRITGDFSNATVASRVAFQTSTANGNTNVQAIPNGTSTTSWFKAYGNADPTNTAMAVFGTPGTDVRFASDITGTGTYLPMLFYTGGSERMRLDTSGNVGIGTNSPAGKLEVSGGRSWFTANSELYSIAFRYSSSTGVMYMGATNSVSTPSIQFSNSGGTALATIDYSGNVGIGTTSPDVKLQTNGIIKSGATGTNGEIQLARTSDGLGVGKVTMTEATQVMNYNNLLGSGIHSFTINATERMRIDSSGNLLLGTSSGTARLVVNGGTSTSQIRWEVNNAAFVNEVSTNAAANAYVYKSNDASYHVWKLSSSEAMRLDTSGNVGIGTSSPNLSSSSTALTVNTGTAANYSAFELASGGTLNYHINANNSAVYHVAAGTRPWVVYTNGSERMRIDSSGNVGIGTSSPSGKLDVRTAAGTSAVMNLSSGSNATVTKFSIQQIGAVDWDIGLTATNGHFAIGGLGGTMAEAYKIVRTGTAIDYQTWNTGGTERMRIDSSGNVGIGTSSPVAKLDVTNNQAALSYLIDTNNTTNGGSSIWRMITRNIANTGTTSVEFYKPTGSGFSLLNNDTNASNFTSFNVGASERMRIDSSGNVGIGTSSPVGKLDVLSSGQNIVVSRSTGSYAAFQRLAPTGQQTYDFYTINGVEVARITGDPSYLAFSTGSSATERARIDSSGNVLVTNPAGLGYGTGSGGTVTQATSRTTAVTINKPTGAITLVSAAGSPAWQEFTVNNSIVTANDTCVLNQRAGTDRYVLQVRSISAGAFVIAFQTTSGTTTEQPIFNFAIIKGAVA